MSDQAYQVQVLDAEHEVSDYLQGLGVVDDYQAALLRWATGVRRQQERVKHDCL